MSLQTTALAEKLLQSDLESKRAAAEELLQMGQDARVAAVELVKACATDDEILCESCVAALEDLGAPEPRVIPELAELAAGEKSISSYWAITLLGRAKEQASTAVGAITTILTSDQDVAVRQRAAWALREIGPSASQAVPSLSAVAKSEDPRLSRMAKQALDSILDG